MEYAMEYHSDQIELYNISLKMSHTLVENNYLVLGFLGYCTKVSSKIIICY